MRRGTFCRVPKCKPDNQWSGREEPLRKVPGRSGLRCFQTGNFDFDATEIRMVIFADAIGDIHQAALRKRVLSSKLGEAPTDSAD